MGFAISQAIKRVSEFEFPKNKRRAGYPARLCLRIYSTIQLFSLWA